MSADFAPAVVEATRAPRATPAPAGIATRLKHPRAHRTPARRAAAAAAGMGLLLAALSALGSWPTLDDCRMDVHARGTPEHAALHADDKHSQIVFIFLLHVTYIGLIIITAVESHRGGDTERGSATTASRLGRIASFWILDALGYAWRVALYMFVTSPWALV